MDAAPVAPDPRLIVALDRPLAREALELAGRLDPVRCRLKVGMELYVAAGPAVVESLRGLGFEVFLDLKFHDIPNTVAGACHAAAALGAWMVNVHASGGRRMLESARAALGEGGSGPLLIAVTVLTSLDQTELDSVGLQGPPAVAAARLARLSLECGLDGVVCSAPDLPMLNEEVPPGFLRVTPGIRPAGSQPGDQRRVATPTAALANGATHLVVGRPITAAADPGAALDRVAAEMERALTARSHPARISSPGV